MMPIFCGEWYTLFPETECEEKEYELQREDLRRAGLNEESLRQMDPDERVVALEAACLDPYDYIFLAC